MKKIFAVMLALCMVFSMSAMVMAADAPFTDVEEDAWYAEEVAYVYENEIMFGVGDKLFAPENAVTRAMVWATLARVDGAEETLKSDPWWLESQKWAMENKISDGTMEDSICTREQLVTMMYRYAAFADLDVTDGEATDLKAFADAENINDWAKEAMEWACAVGLIKGVSEDSLAPQGNATRAQLAAILYRFVEEVMPEIQKPEEPEHQHDYGDWKSDNAGKHSKSCACGKDTITEDCVLDKYTSNEDGTHKKACEKCGYAVEEDCVLEKGKCADCGYTDGKFYVEVPKEMELDEALALDKEYLVIILTDDVTYDIAAWQNNAMGTEKTKEIVINGNGYKITFNNTNSDWNNIVTNGAKLIINDATIENSGHDATSGTWNAHDINFNCEIELNNVVSLNAISVADNAVFNEVSIKDDSTDDAYMLWIRAKGQTVELNDCVIDATGTDGDDRGIKIDNEYLDAEEIA
ncbi:MAG: S-layer homology domain-containing protein, partial [Firmicutes bacterium]|nr:S-layer homology domain-containing protein [Bacillota bacterium]